MLSRSPFKEGLAVQGWGMQLADNLQMSAPSEFISAAEKCLSQGHAFSRAAHVQWLNEMGIQSPSNFSPKSEMLIGTSCSRASHWVCPRLLNKFVRMAVIRVSLRL